MADDPPIEPPIEPAPIPEPPPIESWIAYPTAMAPQNHTMIVYAISEDGWWNGFENLPCFPWAYTEGNWWECRGPKVAEIIQAAILDFREAFGAVFDETGKNDPNLVPTSCLAYIDATVQYNICLRFDLFNLKEDGVTRTYVKDYFEVAWKQAAVYRRHIATTRRRYREELNAPSAVEGTPVMIPRREFTGRCL